MRQKWRFYGLSDTHPLPVGSLTLCFGENGSGKTTYLTGIGLLLGVARLPKGKSYEHYVREGQNWAFLKVVVENAPDAQGKRPFDALIPGSQQQDTCTLACMLLLKNGEWKRTYYIVPGDTFTPSPTMGGGSLASYLFPLDKYRVALEYVGVRSATMRLLELGVTGLHDMHEPRRLFDFFVDLIGSEETRSEYTRARREWRKAQEALEQAHLRYTRQDEEVKSIGKAIEALRRVRALERDRTRYQQCIAHAHLRDLRRAYSEKSATSQRLARELDLAEQERHALIQRQTGIQAEYNEFILHLDAWKAQRALAEHAWNQLSMELTRADERYRVSEETLLELRRPPLYSTDTVTHTLVEQQHRADTHRQLLLRLTEQRDALTQEMRELEQGRSVYPEEVSRFLRILHTQGIPFHLIAESVNVLDSFWLRAVEGILGPERFTVIVDDPAKRLQAKHFGEQHQYRYWISPPKSVRPRSIPAQSLWEVVETTEPGIAGWVQDILLPIRRVETVEEGDTLSRNEGLVTITPKAYRQETRGGRSVAPHQLVCGQASRLARVQEITAELQRVVPLLHEATTAFDLLQSEGTLIREQLAASTLAAAVPTKEQAHDSLRARLAEVEEQKNAAFLAYEQVKQQEQEWRDRDKNQALLVQRITQQISDCNEQIRKTDAEITALRLDTLSRDIERLETTITPLVADIQLIFEREQLSVSEYQERLLKTEEQLEQSPHNGEVYDEELYEEQRAKLHLLDTELSQVRERVASHRLVFENAMSDYARHIDELFSRGMASEFRRLCPLANAQGNIIVQKSDDINDWSLEVRIGFDGKNRVALSEAPLSRGQEVITSLYLVLAALRTVHATPILVLDELMSLLDETNAPKVLAGLKETGVQAFVATPHNRYWAYREADVLWGFAPKEADQVEARPIAVLVSREPAAEESPQSAV